MISLTIVNWKNYQPRNDVQNPHWFRLSRDLLISMQGHRWQDVLAWLALMSEACRKQRGAITVCELITAPLAKQSVDDFLLSIENLQIAGMIDLVTLRPRDVHVTSASRIRALTGQDITEQKKRALGAQKSGYPPCSEFDQQIAQAWATEALSLSRTVKPDPPAWSDAVRKLRELDRLTEADITMMLEHFRSDDFWRKNAVSLPALRTRMKNGLLKAENLLTSARDTAARTTPTVLVKPKVRSSSDGLQRVDSLEELKRQVRGE